MCLWEEEEGRERGEEERERREEGREEGEGKGKDGRGEGGGERRGGGSFKRAQASASKSGRAGPCRAVSCRAWPAWAIDSDNRSFTTITIL